MNYRLYAVDNYWQDCVDRFETEFRLERMYAAVEQVIEDHFKDQVDCLGELNNDAESAECLTTDVCEAIGSFLREEVK